MFPESSAGLHHLYHSADQNLLNPPSIPSFPELKPALAGPGVCLLGPVRQSEEVAMPQEWSNARHHPLSGEPATLALLPFQIIFKVCLAAWNKLIALEANPTHYSLGLNYLSFI